MLATRRSSVTVAAGMLQKAGLIGHSRVDVKIIDRPLLEEAACECHRIMRRERTQISFCAVARIPMSLAGIDKPSGKAYKSDPRLQPLQAKLLTSNDGKTGAERRMRQRGRGIHRVSPRFGVSPCRRGMGGHSFRDSNGELDAKRSVDWGTCVRVCETGWRERSRQPSF
jgi:hypothetical protein